MKLPPIDPALGIASVHLAVSDLSRSAGFYESVLGLPLISRGEESALLGCDRARPLLELTRLAQPIAAPRRSTGLFHFALLHPTRAALAESVLRVTRSGWPFDGVADHGVSEALYLSDPDGLGIEIYVDRPREQWQRPAAGHGVKMVTLPLNTEDLLAQARDAETPTMAAETVMGHVHLKVADVPRSIAFYRDALGLEEQAVLPSAGFLSAGGYHHHVGVNSWESRGGQPSPDGAPGLRLVEFELSGPAALEALERRWSQAPGATAPLERDGERRLSLRDPDGSSLAFTHA
jgi:catechol 2,3-dioxygenase